MNIHIFTFNPFEENAYLLYDETGQCVIVDPGCLFEQEEKELAGFIESKSLEPQLLLNTHCHLDHIFGNAWVVETYGIPLHIHRDDLPILQSMPQVSRAYGIPCKASPPPDEYFEDGDRIGFGQTELEVIHVPGHSPGGVCFHHPESKSLVGGDAVFYMSIGRTDLPGGDHRTLIESIRSKLMTLPEDTVIYPGHGPATRVGYEKVHNPFL